MARSLIGQLNYEIEMLEANRAQFQKLIDARLAKLRLYHSLVWLDSVCAYINPETGLVYPSDASSDPILDDEQAVHIDDCCDEWFSSLSGKDTIVTASCRFQQRGDIA